MGLQALLEEFRPHGHRLGIVLLTTSDPADVAAASAALARHGLTPERRLARLHPRPGEDRHRGEDVADFLRRYGHEYAVAWLPGDRLDQHESIETAARASGCALGWS
jgi:hypothetical protein